MEVNISEAKDSENFSLISKVFFLLLISYYLFNFTGHSSLKFAFPLLLVLASLAILWERSLINALCPVLAMIFVIGQGKVLWSYHPFFHIAFDYLQILFIFKVIYRRKKFLHIEAIPLIILIPIILHFLWYLAQLFNIYNVGFIGTLAAGRAYILPIIFFFAIINTPVENEKSNLINLSKVCLFSFLGFSALSVFQFYKGQDFLIGMASYYQVIMGLAFIDDFFRPFATTELPGGYSVYFFTLSALILMSQLSNRLAFFFYTVILPLTLFSAIISQVRSAYIKYFFILILSCLVIMIASKIKPLDLVKKLIPGLMIVSILSIFSFNFFDQLDLENTIMRATSIFDSQVVGQTRSGPEAVLNAIITRIGEKPLGLGPGRTGAAAGFSRHIIMNDPVYGLEYSWAFDNLFVSLATDLGFGMFIYVFLLIAILIYLLKSSYSLYRAGDMQSFRLVSIAFITCFITFLGNWGAIGLVYNPEAFSFWLLTGLAFKIIFIARKKRQRDCDVRS